MAETRLPPNRIVSGRLLKPHSDVSGIIYIWDGGKAFNSTCFSGGNCSASSCFSSGLEVETNSESLYFNGYKLKGN